jgi:hypothetical protein
MKYCRLCGELIDYGEDMVDGMHEQCYEVIYSIDDVIDEKGNSIFLKKEMVKMIKTKGVR